MEVANNANNEEFDTKKNTRIKQNIRVVSGSKNRKRLVRLCSKNSDLDKRLSSATSSTSKVSADIEHLKKEIARRASTMPDLLETYDLKAVYEETTLRRQFRQAIAVRNHTSPAIHRQPTTDPVQNIYRDLNKPSGPVHDEIIGVLEKHDSKLKDYLKRHNQPRGSLPSGLWNMAASTMYEQRASVNHSLEDLAMAFISKQIAVRKMRQKIARKLELPLDKFKRIAILRQNVNFIEQKFENLKQVRPKHVTKSFDNLNVFEEVNDDDIPSRFTQPGMAKSYFRKSGRLVLVVLNWIFLIMDGSETTKLERELKSFVDIAHEAVNTVTSSQSMEEQGLSFDKQAYKANKEISLSQEHRKILTTRSNFRTPDMIKQVMHGLQAIRSLSDYPLRTQERLCQVAWYQTIGAKKVIIRQGHNAESFYFIVSGTAFVKKMVRNERSGETKVQAAARLTRGQSFGEIGLIFNTKRTATVESSTPMELLVIGKEDFNAIFMRSDDQDDEAEHVKFLRSVPIMSQWPIESLANEPGTCVLHYFKRGHLITPNGKTSEWIYFVKSGTCEVMKELKSPKARKSGHSNLRPDPISDIMLPELGGGASPRVDTGIAHKRKFVMTPEVFEEMSKYYDKLKQRLKETKKNEKEEEKENNRKLHEKKKEQQISTLPKLAINNQLISIKEDSVTESTGSIKSSEILKVPPVESMKIDKSKGLSTSTFNDKMLSLLRMKPHYMFPTASMIEKEAPQKRGGECVSEENTVRKNTVFVHVQLLQAKDVFGLNTLSWGSCDIDDMVSEAPQLCLVSRGAEIVMMSKRVFLKYSNDKVKTMLREHVRPYPTESALQDTFQTKVDWDSYKSHLLENVLKNQCILKNGSGLV